MTRHLYQLRILTWKERENMTLEFLFELMNSLIHSGDNLLN